MYKVASAVDVVIIDSAEATLLMLEVVLKSAGYSVQPMRDAEGLSDIIKSCSPACILLDLFTPGAGGLDLVKELCALPDAVPVVVMSGPIRTSIVVNAIKSGAVDFLEKPFDPALLLTCIRQTVAAFRHRHRGHPGQPEARVYPGLHLLTGRENQVLIELAHGASSKEAGRNLGISPRTVDVHRARIKKKLHAKRAVDLVRIVYNAGDKS
jgi:two-component system, LuxR family, response regulator FixJ